MGHYCGQSKMESDEKPRRSSKRKKDKKSKKSKKSKKQRRSRSPSCDAIVKESENIGEKSVDEDYSHQQVVDMVQQKLDGLLSADNLLHDLPSLVTLEEVNSLIALEKGQAINVIIEKADASRLKVIIHENATVGDLKKAVQRATDLNLGRQHNRTTISWKHVWKSYWLLAHGHKLKQQHRLVKQYAIANNDSISFIRRLKEK